MVRAVKPHLQCPLVRHMRQLNCRVSKNIFHQTFAHTVEKRIYFKDFILLLSADKHTYDKWLDYKTLISLWKRLFYRAMKNK